MRTTSSNMTEPEATVPQSRFPGEREGEMDLETFVREEEEVVGAETERTCLSSYVDEGSTESHRYYLSRRTVMEMLKDRGYAVPIEQIQVTLQEFRAIYGQTPNLDLLSVSFSHRSNPSKKIKVIFSGPGVVKVHMIRNLAGQIGNHGSYSGMILILENRITNPALKAVDLFSFKVEIFQITDLLVNITKHVLKPKHRILSKAEKQNLLKNYNIEEKQLPRMLKTDAIARYYGLQRGQVVKIIYNSGITKSHVTYRCVW